MAIQDMRSFRSADVAEELLIDVARRIQLSPTKHDLAVGHYEALCQYVDRPESPLHDVVGICYPSGSFGIGAVVASRVRKNQHDLDVVLELHLPISTPPADVLQMLHEAIEGEPRSRYYGKTALNSRCVTVEYEDGFKVDLMPLVRDGSPVERRGFLFHSKDAESYVKPVNPFGFKTHYNNVVETDPGFVTSFRQLNERVIAKAIVEPMEDHIGLEEKSPRTVALQLLKRLRDVRYRQVSHDGRRCPPSVVLAAFALDKPDPRHTLLWELLEQIRFLHSALAEATARGSLIDVRNPTWGEDRFTDRWPARLEDQILFTDDLEDFGARLEAIAGATFSPVETKAALQQLFGETAATFAIEEAMIRKSRAADRGELKFSPRGGLLSGAAAATAATGRAAARSSTDFGGDEG